MSNSPKIEHEYHAGKDELKIWVHGYALKRKKTREGTHDGLDGLSGKSEVRSALKRGRDQPCSTKCSTDEVVRGSYQTSCIVISP
jgi:hypothetical protein